MLFVVQLHAAKKRSFFEAERGGGVMLHGTCRQCQGQMAVLDILLEGYDLVCTRCGQREIINHGLTQPPPCYQ